jgi:tetratricopeptide (TPR) repeat protein
MRGQTPQLIWDDTLATVFQRVNRLAAEGLYFQSIALYEELIKVDSQEFLPHVGYSIVLEKVGFYRKALQELETGIALMPDSLGEAKVAFENRKTELSDRVNAQKKWKDKIFKLNDNFNPKTMLYAGGMATESSGSFYSRFGLFLNSTFNGAVDFGLSGGKEFFSVNIGISAYKRFFGFLMWGEGINLQTGSSTVVSLKSTVGLSFINRRGNSSWDIFFDYYLPFKREVKGIFGFSVGKSIYFGKREGKRK